MKNSFVKRLLCGILAIISVFSMVACNSGGGGGNVDDGGSTIDGGGSGGGTSAPDHSDADETKTQLDLFNYEAGYGREWVDSLIKRFEEACKDVSFEPGKKGVQVFYGGSMSHFNNADIGAQPFDVFFLENDDYYELKMGGKALVNIDDIVRTNDLTLYDGTSFKSKVEAAGYSLGDANDTIESKLNAQQKAFYTSSSADGNGYYAVPSYASSYGLIYDVQLWKDYKYYIVQDANFHIQGDRGYSNKPLSVGPDGISGTYDDGLPRTYDEFWQLCEKIYNNVHIPIAFAGKYPGYVNSLDFNLINNYLGFDQMMLNYNFEGLAKDLIKVNGDGTLQIDANGVPTLEEKQITLRTGYELWRSASVYYALTFVKNLYDKNVSHYHDEIADQNHSHVQTQRDFIEWGNKLNDDGEGINHIAMLLDGFWWQREATPYSYLVYPENKNFLMEHEYGWLPLPHATIEKANEVKARKEAGGKANVLADALSAFGVIKTGLSAGREAAAKALLLFSCSYDSCMDFTIKTGTIKGLDYTVDTTDLGKLSPFTQSVLTFVNDADKVYNCSGLEFYNANRKNFLHDSRYTVEIGSSKYNNVSSGILANPKVSPKYYMEQIYKKGKSFFDGYSWS